jgi:NAD(P)-dependent dehydrogenase (short-subunit alcohol dehydrogenase family)
MPVADALFDVRERVVLITGGGTGIGKGLAEGFARRGAKVVITSRNDAHLKPVAEALSSEGLDVAWLSGDVRRVEDVEHVVDFTVQRFGRLDVLVNNAAASFACPVERLSPNAWATIVAIDLNGVFLMSRAAGAVMIRQGGGRIINISSTAGVYGFPHFAHYSAAKAGVINFTRTLAMEWARYGILVNCVAPGPIETEGATDVTWPTDDLARRIREANALRRLGTVEEILGPCVFLASRAAGFVTGQTLLVDGGTMSVDVHGAAEAAEARAAQ